MQPIATDVLWSMVGVLVTLVSCAKIVEPVKMQFGVRLVRAEGTLYSMGVKVPHEKGHF